MMRIKICRGGVPTFGPYTPGRAKPYLQPRLSTSMQGVFVWHNEARGLVIGPTTFGDVVATESLLLGTNTRP